MARSLFGRNALTRTGRKTPRSSRLTFESLETRTLLSVNMLVPPIANSTAGMSTTIFDLRSNALSDPAAPLAATQFGMSLPERTQTGVAANVMLSARNAQNRPAVNYSGTVTLTSSDPLAVLPATVTFVNGYAHLKVTFNTSGTQTLTATDNATTPLTTSKQTAVAAPLVATQFVMSLPERTQTGVAANVMLSARNSQNRPVINYSGTVTLTSSDPLIVLPATVTFVNGYAQFKVTFNTLGTQTLTATDNATTPLTTSKQTAVAAPLVATQFVLSLSERTQSGVAVNVMLSARNSQNRPVVNYSGTVTLTSSDPLVVLPATVTFVNGYAQFKVTFNSSGTQTLTATDNSATPLTTSKQTAVSAPLAATKFVMSLPEQVQTGDAVNVVLSARNAKNQPVINYSGTVTLTSSDPLAVLPATVTFVNGYAQIAVSFNTIGTQTLTATDNSATPLTTSKQTAVS